MTAQPEASTRFRFYRGEKIAMTSSFRHTIALMVAVLLALSTAFEAAASTPVAATAATEQYTPLVPSVPSAPQWFPGSDGQVHLVYELFLTNAFPVPVDISSVQVIDTNTGAELASLSGDVLSASASLLASPSEPSVAVPPSSIGVVWLDIPLASKANLPQSVSHVLTVQVPPGLPVPDSITMTGATAAVDLREPVVIGPPLIGPNWAAIGSCCDGPHRRAFQPIDGALDLSQRFAIDFNLLDGENRLSFGDPTSNESVPGYGQPVIAVADATVVQALDGLPDQTPGSPLVDISLATADGNHVILDLGNGAYAFYAHLVPGSVAVSVGDTVTKGQVIGKLGNSGSSDGAHLHFHMMDGPSALAANSVPYVFDSYEVTGQLPTLAEMVPYYEEQGSIPVDVTNASQQIDTLPLGGNVMSFPEND